MCCWCARADATWQDAEEEAKAATIKKGQRCLVETKGQPARRGAVMFVGACMWHVSSGMTGAGHVEFGDGWWVGVALDEPAGKHDGRVEGVAYFACAPKHGVMVRPAAVTTGDFPEEEIALSDDEM